MTLYRFHLMIKFSFILDVFDMAYDDPSPPKKRWQQQNSSPSFLLDAHQWRQQNILILDQKTFNRYHLGVILDIIDSHLVLVSFNEQSLSSVTIDIHQITQQDFPWIIIDNIPACQDLLPQTRVCVRTIQQENNQEFLCGTIRLKHPTRLEFSIDFKDDLIMEMKDRWFTRQNIRLLIEPWHEEYRLYQENLSTKTLFRPISSEKNDEQIVSPIEQDDEEIEREFQKRKESSLNKLQGIKKGDIFTMG